VDKKLREAVDYLQGWINAGVENKEVETLIDLAERYLDVDGFPSAKETKIKGLQGQMKKGEKSVDCSPYPRGMKHEVLAHYQSGYMRGLSIGIDIALDDCKLAYIDLESRYNDMELDLLKARKDLLKSNKPDEDDCISHCQEVAILRKQLKDISEKQDLDVDEVVKTINDAKIVLGDDEDGNKVYLCQREVNDAAQAICAKFKASSRELPSVVDIMYLINNPTTFKGTTIDGDNCDVANWDSGFSGKRELAQAIDKLNKGEK